MATVRRQEHLRITNHSTFEAVILSPEEYDRLAAVAEYCRVRLDSRFDALKQRFDTRLKSLEAPDAGNRLRQALRTPISSDDNVIEGMHRLDEAVANLESFVFETPLGGNTVPEKIRQASATHDVLIWYCGLDTPELHLERVRSRVAQGGHRAESAKPAPTTAPRDSSLPETPLCASSSAGNQAQLSSIP